MYLCAYRGSDSCWGAEEVDLSVLMGLGQLATAPAPPRVLLCGGTLEDPCAPLFCAALLCDTYLRRCPQCPHYSQWRQDARRSLTCRLHEVCAIAMTTAPLLVAAMLHRMACRSVMHGCPLHMLV